MTVTVPDKYKVITSFSSFYMCSVVQSVPKATCQFGINWLGLLFIGNPSLPRLDATSAEQSWSVPGRLKTKAAI